MDHTLNSQQQADADALASAVSTAAQSLGLDGIDHGHHFHHQLQAPDFSQAGLGLGDDEKEEGVDVTGLGLPDDGDLGEEDLGLNLDDLEERDDRPAFSRPPSIRKACDLCHAAKQKCSGDRPTCTRCAAGGWQCNYAPRQRRRTVPKEHRSRDQQQQQQQQHSHANSQRQASTPREMQPPVKKRKLDMRSGLGFESAIDLKAAMAALDMGMGEEEGEEMLTMSDEQMLESIAIDGYLADLPLSTFVNNLPYTAPPPEGFQVGPEDITSDPFHSVDNDQHTTSALRDAIFSLKESTQNGYNDGADVDDGQEGEVDPHLALLNLTNAEGDDNEDDHADLLDLQLGCNHPPLVPHILALLTQHGLEPKPGYSTPLTLSIFAPLSRSLRLFQLLTDCPTCSTSPQQTLPQLALLSRTTTILTFPYPPILSSAIGGSAQITVHGARLAGTGISEAIETHIVGVVWDSWRASVREIFALLDKKAQDVIQQSTAGEGLPITSAETQRAGLFFQAMGRLVTAMDEVEGP